MFLTQSELELNGKRLKVSHTRRSFGVCLASGSFSRQLSTKTSASLGNRPSGDNLGAGSFTICCSNSRILIVIPPPCRLTPLLFRFFFLSRFSFAARASARFKFPGLLGDSVLSKSDRSESSDAESENGNRPKASSISDIPSDHTSDLTVYCAPCIRSGCKRCARYVNLFAWLLYAVTHTHVC